MTKFVNKSTRIFHFESGMLPPGSEGEVSEKELESAAVKAYVEVGELAEPGEAKKADAKAEGKDGKPAPNQPAASVQGDKVKG